MNLRQLRAFVTVCQIGNVSKAASVLHLSQPALSRQIQDLESEFGGKFFSREKRRIALTDAGYLFLVRAQEMLAVEERAKREIAASSDALAGVIRFAAVESAAAGKLMKMIAPWLAAHPHIELELYSADGDDIRRSIDEDQSDFALVLEPVETAKYDSVPFVSEERWGIVLRKADVPEGKEDFSASDFARFPVILPRRRIVRDALASRFSIPADAIQCRIYHNLPSNALSLVRTGAGGLVCVEGSYRNRPSDDLQFLPFAPEMPCAYRLIRKRGRVQTKPAEMFWNFASEEVTASAD